MSISSDTPRCSLGAFAAFVRLPAIRSLMAVSYTHLNPYVFDGSMSIEDYELMHRMMNEERSEQMAEPILSGYLSNLGKYTEGRPAGEWVTFPTTAEHLKEVFDLSLIHILTIG